MNNEQYYELHNKYIKLQEAFNDTLDLNQKLGSENVKLLAQIEKMKICQNCKFEDNDYMGEPCRSCSRCLGDIKRKGNSDKWELQE